jgi:alkylation response protein AidB-like acyl-CoA dehydrogenase
MQFAFTEDQLAFRDAVRDLLAGTCSPVDVRAAWDADDPWSADRWGALVEMGVVDVAGLGLNEVDLVLLLEEAGWAALPEPLAESALLGDGTQKVAAAAADATHVAGAASADLVVVGTRTYEPVDVDPQPSVDRARRLVRVGDLGEPTGEVDDPFDRMAFATAAVLVGLARRLVTMTVEYAKERQQFGQPIGGFQAVKHHLANAHLAVEFAAPAVYRAAWSLANDEPTVGRDVSMAKAMAGDAAEQAARVALQCHGAIGYTFESDLHLWMKRVWALSPAWGDAAFHRRRVADAVIG